MQRNPTGHGAAKAETGQQSTRAPPLLVAKTLKTTPLPRKRGDQRGRPTSRNLPPPFLTKNATIEQRTSVHEDGELVPLAEAKSPERHKAKRKASPSIGSPATPEGEPPRAPRAVGGAPASRVTRPPKSSTPSLPAIGAKNLLSAPGTDGEESGTPHSGRRRSNTHQPSRGERGTDANAPRSVAQRLRSVPKLPTDGDAKDAKREKAVGAIVKETRERGALPVGRDAVARLNRAFEEEDADYAAFVRKRDGRPPRGGVTAAPAAAAVSAAGSQPASAGTPHHQPPPKIVASGSQTAPQPRPSRHAGQTPASATTRYAELRSPRRVLNFSEPPAQPAAAGTPLPALAGDDQLPLNLQSANADEPAAQQDQGGHSKYEQSRVTLPPGNTPHGPAETPTEGAPSRNANRPSMDQNPSAFISRESSNFVSAGRYRIDETTIEITPSPSALTAARRYRSTGTGSSSSPPDHGIAEADADAAKQLAERRRFAALRTIALASAPAPGAPVSSNAVATGAAYTADAYAGEGYGEQPTSGRSRPSNYAATNYGAATAYGDDAASATAERGNAYAADDYGAAHDPVPAPPQRSSTDSTPKREPQPPLRPASEAQAPLSPHRGSGSPQSTQAFRLRLAEGGREIAASPAVAPSPLPKLSFLELAEQIVGEPLIGHRTSDDLHGSIKFSVRSPAVMSPNLAASAAAAESTVPDFAAPPALSGTMTSAGGASTPVLPEAAGSVALESAEERYLSAAAAQAEAHFWRKIRDSGSKSALSGYAASAPSSLLSAPVARGIPPITLRRRQPSTSNSDLPDSHGDAPPGSSSGNNNESWRARRRLVGIDSMRRSTVDVASCNRPWNEAFQALLERPCATPVESLERGKCIRRLCTMFKEAMSPVIESIVLERSLPNDDRVVKLQKVGGVAGGDKYAIGNIFLKYCGSMKAVSPKLYGDHIWALKSATNELKGLNALIRAGVPHLHVPLGMTATFLGQRLWVCTRLPIDGLRTLKYGSPDGGTVLRTVDTDSRLMAAKAAGILNLKPHRVGAAGEAMMPTPVDLEIHHGDDGRYYVVDTARLFPPDANPASGLPKNYHLHKVMRPERVHDAETPLSSDALCQLGAHDPEHRVHDREVREASETITASCVPMLARQLGRLMFEEAERRLGSTASAKKTEFDSGSAATISGVMLRTPANDLLKSNLHDYGINLRYMGRVLDEYLQWAAVASQPLPVSVACTHLVAEIVARAFKSVVNAQLNDFATQAMARDAAGGSADEAHEQHDRTLLHADDIASFHHLVVELYELLFGGATDSKQFWALALMPMIMRKFRCDSDTLEAIFSCHSRASITVPWIAANHVHALIFRRANELLGVSWHVDADRDRDFISRLAVGGTAVGGDSVVFVNSPGATSKSAGASSALPTSGAAHFTLPLLKSLEPVVKVCDISPFASVAELERGEDFAKAEQLYLSEVEIRSLALGETPALAPLLSNLADLYARWPGRETDELNLRRRIVLLHQRAWEATITANPTDFEAFFSEADGGAFTSSPEELLKTIPPKDLARASSNTVLLPLTPPYVDSLNALGKCLLKNAFADEALEALQTAARMAAARLAVAAYANPSLVVAEQIKHEEQQLLLERRLSVGQHPRGPPAAGAADDGDGDGCDSLDDDLSSADVDETDEMEASLTFGASVLQDPTALAAAVNPNTSKPADDAAVVVVTRLTPVERAALEAELELHAVTTRQLLADAFVTVGSLPDALAERHSAIVMSRRICARRGEQVLALAATVLAPSRSMSTNKGLSGTTASESQSANAASPRTGDVGLRAMLAEVGVKGQPAAAFRDAGDGTTETGHPDAGSTSAAVTKYCEALRDLSATLLLCGRGKFACGVSDEVLRVVLNPTAALRSASSGGPGDRPEVASPIHHPGVLLWFKLILQRNVSSRALSATEKLVLGGDVGGASTAVAAVFKSAEGASGSHSSDTAAERDQRVAAFSLATRAMVPEDREHFGEMVDPATQTVLQSLDDAISPEEAAQAFLCAVDARIEDWSFVGDAAAAMPPAILALAVLVSKSSSRGSASSHHAHGRSQAAVESAVIADGVTCRALMTVGRLLIRVGAHREGVKLLQRCWVVTKANADDAAAIGHDRSPVLTLAAECALRAAECTVLSTIELEGFLPVPDSLAAVGMADDHATAGSGGRAQPDRSSLLALLQAVGAGPAGRLNECEDTLRDGLGLAVRRSGREDGVLQARLQILLAAAHALTRNRCSLIPAFTAPPFSVGALAKPLAAVDSSQRESVALTRYTNAAPGMSKYNDAVEGLRTLRHTLALGMLALEKAGDTSSPFFCLGLCLTGVAAVMPLTDALVLGDILQKEIAIAGLRRATQGRTAPSSALTETPHATTIALLLLQLHGISPSLDEDDRGSSGMIMSRENSAVGRALSPLRSPSPSMGEIESVEGKFLRGVLSEAFDSFFRALATSDEHMSLDMLDYLSRRCVNHATLIEQRCGISHNAPRRTATGAAPTSATGPTAGAPGASAVPLSRGCQKRRLQAMLTLAPIQLLHGDSTGGIASCKAALTVFRDLFPYRTPWDPLEDSLLVSLRSFGSWLIRTQPIGADRDLGSTVLRIVERELEKRSVHLQQQVARANRGAEDDERDAFIARQHRLTAQLQQISYFGRLSRVDNVHCLLLHALDDFALLYPDGANGAVPHSVNCHNELVTHISTLMRIMNVPHTILDRAIKAETAASRDQSVGPTPAAGVSPTTTALKPPSTSSQTPTSAALKPPLPKASPPTTTTAGTPAWQDFARSARNASGMQSGRAVGLRSTAGGAGREVMDAELLAHNIFRFENLVHHAMSTLYVLRHLPRNFTHLSAEVTDNARRERRRLERFSLGA